ncbi:hypothetical protein HK096_011340, partial [Nowakowskiella sp. JEL0078]
MEDGKSTKKYTESVHEEIYDSPEIPSEKKRVIAVAIDSSSHSEYAIQYVLDNVAQAGDQIVLLNCRPVPSVPSIGISGYSDFEWAEKIENEAKLHSHALLKKFGALVLKQKGLAARAIALRGDAREELVSKVNELNASLFVLGSRGLGTFQRTLLGSVSDYAIHH